MRLAPARGLPGGRGYARVVRGLRRAESRRAPAEGGGAASVKSGAPSGRGGNAGCCGAGGWTDGDVTGLPLASLPSSGRQVAGRPAAGPRPRRERDLRAVRAGGQGRGRGGARRCPSGRRGAGGWRAGRPWLSAIWDDPRSPRLLSRAACGAAGRPDAPARQCCDGQGRRDARAVAFLHREIRARLRSPRISKPGC
ncbi:hypothetical protein NN561_007593 [Cricetulus griseus]